MEIKPIKTIPPIERLEIPQTKIDRNLPRAAPTQPSFGKWSFQKGQIVYQGQTIAQVMEASVGQPPAFWSNLASELNAFRNHFIQQQLRKKKRKKGATFIEDAEDIEDISKLSALVEAYIGKIMRILKRKYDETKDGMSFTLDEDGQLVLNGVNVTSFIHLAKNYPSEKAHLFLKGLKNRLSIVLANKSANPNYEKMRDTVDDLFRQIDQEMERILEKTRIIENI